MSISDKVITFKKESKLKDVLIVAIVGVAIAVAVFMTVLYVTKVPTAAKISEIQLHDSYGSLKSAENNTYYIDLPPYSNYNIFYTTEPVLSVKPTMKFTSTNTEVAYVSIEDGTISLYTGREGSSTSIIDVTKKLQVKINITVKPLLISEAKLNFQEFFTDSTNKSGIMYIGQTITLKPRFVAVINVELGRTTEVSKTCQFDVVYINGGSDIISTFQSAQKNSEFVITAQKAGKLKIAVTPQGITENEKLLIGQVYIEIEIVNLPSKLTVNQAGINKENLQRELLSGEAFMLYGSDSGNTVYNLADYVNLISTNKDTPIYLADSQSKGLTFSVESNQYVELDAATGLLTIKPLTDGRNITLFFSVVSKYRAVTTFTFAARIELRVTKIKAIGVNAYTGAGDGKPVLIKGGGSINDPILITDNDNYIEMEYNDGVSTPTETKYRLAVIANYSLEQDNIDLPLPEDSEIVSISGSNIRPSSFSKRRNGKVRIGIWSIEVFPHLTDDDFIIDYTDARFQRGFSEIWISVNEEPVLRALTFESGNLNSISKEIYLPASDATDLSNYLYPFPSRAAITGNAVFEKVSGSCALNGSVIGAMTPAQVVTVAVKSADDDSIFCTFTIIPFAAFTEEEFKWRDALNGNITTGFDAVYLKNTYGNGSTYLAGYIADRLNISNNFNYPYIVISASGSSGNVSLTDRTLNVSGYSKTIRLTAKIADGGNAGLDGIKEYYNYQNILTGKKNYYGATEISVTVNVIFGATDIAILQTPGSAVDYSNKALRIELDGDRGETAVLSGLWRLQYPAVPSGIAESSLTYETAKVAFSGDGQYFDWDAESLTVTAKRNNGYLDKSGRVEITIIKSENIYYRGVIELVNKRKSILPDNIVLSVKNTDYDKDSDDINISLQPDIIENSFVVAGIALTSTDGTPEQTVSIEVSDNSVLSVTKIANGYMLTALDIGSCKVEFSSVLNPEIKIIIEITVEFSSRVFSVGSESVALTLNSGYAEHTFKPEAAVFKDKFTFNAALKKDYGSGVRLINNSGEYTLELNDCLLTEQIIVVVTADYKNIPIPTKNITFSITVSGLTVTGVATNNSSANPIEVMGGDNIPVTINIAPLSASYITLSYIFSDSSLVSVNENGTLITASNKGGTVRITAIIDGYSGFSTSFYVKVIIPVTSMEIVCSYLTEDGEDTVLELDTLNYSVEAFLVFNEGASNTDFDYSFTNLIGDPLSSTDAKAAITKTATGFKIRLTQKGNPILLTITSSSNPSLKLEIVIKYTGR